jgi:hypothetical protein
MRAKSKANCESKALVDIADANSWWFFSLLNAWLIAQSLHEVNSGLLMNHNLASVYLAVEVCELVA